MKRRPRVSYGLQETTGTTESVPDRLRPWPEVARIFNERTGENIGRAAVAYIAKRAERKLIVALLRDPELAIATGLHANRSDRTSTNEQ